MKFQNTLFEGVYLIEHSPYQDERGFFLRSFCSDTFQAHGLNSNFKQTSLSYNRTKGTIRGMHLQKEPYGEVKLVRCIQGAVYDVLIDLRPESKTFEQTVSFELTASNFLALYIPENIAHGFQTLADDTELLYQISNNYHPQASFGIRFDDPAFQIPWPLNPCNISTKDREYPLYTQRILCDKTSDR